MKLQKLVFVHYNMRLKLRHTMRRSQQEIDKSFNPINLDYIFEEDDPLSPWLEEREAPLLDGQDNRNWLEVEEIGDDNGARGSQPHEQVGAHDSTSSPERTQSDDNVGLSPPSSDAGDGSDDGNDSHGTASGGGGGVEAYSGFGQGREYDTGPSFVGETERHYTGRYGLQDVPDNYDIGVFPPSPPRRKGGASGSGRQLTRSHGHQHSNLSEDSHGMARSFGDFGLHESSEDSGSCYPYPLPNDPPPPTYPYLGHHLQLQPTPYPPPILPTAPPMYYPPVNYQGQQGAGMNIDFFNSFFPSGWRNNEESQRQSQDGDGDYEEPPRHSVWW